MLAKLNDSILNIHRHKQMIYSWGTKFLASYNGHANRDRIT